jgi:hypothetical protein
VIFSFSQGENQGFLSFQQSENPIFAANPDMRIDWEADRGE